MSPDPDDLDRLFTLVSPPSPPANVGGRARARLRAIRSARRLTLVALADLAALMALAVVAFLLGDALAGSEAPGLVRLAVEDRAVALEARGELARALARSVPWLYVLAAGLDLLALYGLTAFLLHATDTLNAPLPKAET